MYKMGALPFIVSRVEPVPITHQIVRGIRASIQNGFLKVGDRLPTILEIAGDLGVSPMIVRNAVRRLVQSGELCARRKSGIHVASANTPARAHVLYATWGGAVSFYFAARDHAFLTRLRNEGFHVTVVYVDGKEAAAGYPSLKRVLDVQPVSLAVIAGGPFGVDAFLAERGIRFVDAFPETPSPHAMAIVQSAWSVPLRRLARHFASCGNRKCVAFAKADSQRLREAFEGVGIAVQIIEIDPLVKHCDGHQNSVEQAGFQAGVALLEKGGALPDVVYSADDFFTRGLLTSLLGAGIKIPRDVQFATQCNVGNIPVFAKEFTRIELDPQRDGLAMADLARRAALSNRRRYQNVVRIPKFVAGKTTVRRL